MMQPGILAYFLWTCQAPFNWNWRPVKMERAGLHKLATICGRACQRAFRAAGRLKQRDCA